MKKLLLPLALCLFSSLSQAQITKIDDVKKSLETTNKDTIAWAHGGVFNIGVNEGFLHNWAAGGENAFSATALTTLFANYKNTLHFPFLNVLNYKMNIF